MTLSRQTTNQAVLGFHTKKIPTCRNPDTCLIRDMFYRAASPAEVGSEDVEDQITLVQQKRKLLICKSYFRRNVKADVSRIQWQCKKYRCSVACGQAFDTEDEITEHKSQSRILTSPALRKHHAQSGTFFFLFAVAFFLLRFFVVLFSFFVQINCLTTAANRNNRKTAALSLQLDSLIQSADMCSPSDQLKSHSLSA